ncbi:MAG: hypothetical protein JNL74_15330, partial [Fibrobacteres bacterium]|nr:hypothetical protein [Fibrobacterota bacterium]
DYCTLFLSHSIALDYKNSLKLFAFLIPMEYLFEDFIFGFMDKRLPHLDVKPQKSSVSLDDRGIFTLRPDLLVTFQNQQFIADTKYKIIYSDDTDPKKGVSQNDLYQMVAYAIRYNIKAIVLIYPSTIAGCTEKHEQFLISDMFSGVKIQIKIYQVPIINQNIFETNNSELLQQDLKTAFNYTSNLLKQKLSTIFSLA